MLSLLKPNFLYTDISEDVTENDIDVMSDEWNMNGRIVYRGSRDPRYTHANVYWLYDEDLRRVGCTEHDLENHADFQLLWFKENEFGTLLQEDNWTAIGDIWSMIPSAPFERFVNEGWTTPKSFLEKCLSGPVRVLTPEMVTNLPTVYTCEKCRKKSLKPIPTCTNREAPLDLPNKSLLFFIDLDMVVYRPPSDSKIWSILQLEPLVDDLISSVPTEQSELVLAEV